MHKIYSKNNFIFMLAIWCLVNATLFVSSVPQFQYIPVLFVIWAIIILLHDAFTCNEKLICFPAISYSIMFLLAAILSFIFNGFSNPAKNIYSIAAVAINFLIVYTASTEQGLDKFLLKLCKLIFVIAIAFAVISLVLLHFEISIPMGKPEDQLFLGIDILHKRFTGLSGNPNGLSRVFVCGLLSATFLFQIGYIKQKSKTLRLFIYVGVLILFLSLLLTESRASMYGVYFGFFIWSISFTFLFTREKGFLKTTGTVILAALGSGFLIILSMQFNNILIREFPYHNTQNSHNNNVIVTRYKQEEGLLEDNISNGRFTLMKNGIMATIDSNPIFGLTYGGANSSIQKYIRANDIDVFEYLFLISGNMHNTLIQSFAYYGLFGLITLLLFLLYFVKITVRALLKVSTDSLRNSRMAVFLSVLAMFAFMNMVEAVFYFDFDNHLINLLLMLTLSFYVKFIGQEYGKDCLKDKFAEMFQQKLYSATKFLNAKINKD